MNVLINPGEGAIQYQRFEDFIGMVRRAGHGAELGKFDLTDAYKYVLVHLDYWPLLGIHVGSGPSQEYYVETTLPFGHRLASMIFTAFSDTLVWIMSEFGTGLLFKYVDDFAGSGLCHRDLDAVQAACDLTGFESQEEKREGPSTCLAVLDVEVDTIACEMRIGKDKLRALSTDLQLWSRRQVTSEHEIASLHGRLSFVAQVAKPGWVFLRGTGDETQEVCDTDGQLRVLRNFRVEVCWWSRLLAEWNGVSLIYEDQWTTNFNLWTDASGTSFGAYCNNKSICKYFGIGICGALQWQPCCGLFSVFQSSLAV